MQRALGQCPDGMFSAFHPWPQVEPRQRLNICQERSLPILHVRKNRRRLSLIRKGVLTGWVWVAAWTLVSALLFFTLKNAGVASVWEALGQIRIPWLILALAANCFILVLWALAWQRILPSGERGSYPRMLEVVSITAMAMNTLPLPFGHASGALALSKHGRVGNVGALSVLATHEFAEGMAKIAVLLLAASLAPLPEWMRRGLFLIALAAGGLGGILVLLSRLRRVEADSEETPGLVGSLRRVLDGFSAKLEVMKGGVGFFVVFALVLGMKASEATAILCVQRALGVEIPLTHLPGVLGAVMLASLVPLAPANLGTYEAGAYFIYLQAGVSPGTAMALAMVQHLMLLTAFLGAGYAVLFRRSLFHYAGTGEGLPARVLRAFGFWIRYLLFSGVVGLFALGRRRGNGEGEEAIRR